MIRTFAWNLIRAAAVGSLMVFGTSVVGHSEDLPVLKSRTVVSKNIVTIGDLFHAPGMYSKIAVFQAPDPGVVGTVATSQILKEVGVHGMRNVDTQGLQEVMVIRADNVITKSEIEKSITAHLRETYSIGHNGELNLSFDKALKDIPTEVLDSALEVVQAQYRRASGRFSTTLSYKVTEKGEPRQLKITGMMIEMVEVPILLSSKSRGDLVLESDIGIEKKPANRMRGTIVNKADIIGKELRRTMNVGALISSNDIKEPTLISRNDIVSVVYSGRGLRLTTRGKALESGARGDIVTVATNDKKKTLRGIVKERGQVVITELNF